MTWLPGLFGRRFSNGAVRADAGRSGRRGRRFRGSAAGFGLGREILEQRLALTIDIFTNAAAGVGVQPGSVTIVSSAPDYDIYLQQIATNPQNLLVANNSSFNGYQAVENINQYRSIYITTGTIGATTHQASDFYPTDRGTTTTSYVLSANQAVRLANIRFGNNGGGGNNGDAGYAMQVSYAGSQWRFDDTGAVVSGPTNVPIRPLTATVSFGNPDFAFDSSLDITWSARPVANAALGIAAPHVDTVRYLQNEVPDFIIDTPPYSFTDFNLDPSSGANPLFTLPMPANAPRVSLIEGTLTGTISVAGQSINFRTAAFGSDALLFGSGTTFDFGMNNADPDPRRLQGTIDWATGTIYLAFSAVDDAGDVLGPQDCGPVTLSARYAVGLVDPRPTTVTVFPGLDITREFVVDLLAPGSTLNVESPIRNSTTTATAVAVLGSGTGAGTVGSVVLVGGGGVYSTAPTITIAPPPTGGTQATAIATINPAGTVTSVTVTNPGSGYTTAPTVTFTAPTTPVLDGADVVVNATNVNIDAQVVANERFDIGPEAIDRYFGQNFYAGQSIVASRVPKAIPATAVAQVIDITARAQAVIANGRVDGIAVLPGSEGLGYDPLNPPAVTIAAPPAGGTRATAVALVTQGGRIAGFRLTNAGSGYTTVPLVTVGAPTGGVGAVVVLPGQGGSGYDPLNLPSVTVAAPLAGGRQATAVPIVNAGGVIAGFTITDPGRGYTSVPAVTISAPRSPTRAVAAAAVLGDGTIGGVTLSQLGSGYFPPPAAAPVVTIAPPPPGSGGTRAEAQAVVDANGVMTGIVVTYPGSGYDPATPPLVLIEAPFSTAVAEKVNLNSAVGASVYDIRIGDDLGTSDDRGRLFISPTGSLSGNASQTSQVVNTPATNLYVQADTSDVIVEGTIFANNQSYLLRSVAERNYLAPFLFTTRSPLSGADTGLIHGAVVGVTLGNDVPAAQAGSTASNDVELSTAIDSFRITASNAAVNPSVAFPYTLTINERDDIEFDAVAASSGPITIAAGGSIRLNSALATQGDLTITATRQDGGPTTTFRVSAPISTTVGRIAITADDVYVSNALRVTAAALDAAEDDITLTATGGSISLAGAVKVVNNVRLVQSSLSSSVIGGISGPALITAGNVSVAAQGAVDIRTRAVSLSGVAGTGFAVNEADDIAITSLESGGLVSLTAAGADPGPGNANQIALQANLVNVQRLAVSAPAGSIGVFNNSSYKLVLGDATSLQGRLPTAMMAAGSVKIRSYGDIDVLDAPLAGGSARAVRTATSAVLNASYAVNSPGTVPSTLTGSGSINATGAFGGVTDLRVGERVLVKNGSRAAGLLTDFSNGVYTVTRIGGGVGVNANWVLTRSADADTGGECPTNTFVRVAEGLYAAGDFQLSYDSIPPSIALRSSTSQLELAPEFVSAYGGRLRAGQLVTGAGIAAGATIQAFDAATGVVTLPVGSITGTGPTLVRFVTSAFGQVSIRATQVASTTDIGTETVDGMLTFVTSTTGATNTAAGSFGKMISLVNVNAPGPDENQEQSTRFAFASWLGGPIQPVQQLPVLRKAVEIDGGSRYGTGTSAVPVVIDGSRITQTRTGTAVLSSSVVHGLEIGSGVTGAVVRNLTLGGFAKGAALRVVGARQILIDGVAVGMNSTGGRLPNLVGIWVTGASDTVTVSNALVNSSVESGIRVNGSATGVAVVNAVVGGLSKENAVGVEFTASGSNRLGVNVPQAAVSVGALAVTRLSATQFALPKTFSQAASLVPGMGVSGGTIVPGTGRASATIAAVTTDAITKITTVTITDGTISSSGTVTFANYVQTTIDRTTLAIPAAVSLDSLFLGQSVRGTGIPSEARIASIDPVARTIELTTPMTASGVTAVTFVAGGRNTVAFNRYGVILAAGRNTVTNTSVSNSTFDGVTISGGTQAIGTSAAANGQSNAIFSNSGYGIVVRPAALATTTIRGNYLGTQPPATTLLPNVRGNISVTPVQAKWVPNPDTNVDASGNVHGLPKAPVSGGGSGGSGGGTGSGTGINPPGIFPRI